MDPRPAATRKVLVVDDSLTVRRSAERALRGGGHEVLLAADGFEALALIHDFAPDLVFCDILMPRLDVFQIPLAFQFAVQLYNILYYSFQKVLQ